MGLCLATCQICCSKTFTALDITHELINSLEKSYISKIRSKLKFDINTWRPTLDEETKKKIQSKFSPILLNYFNENKINALQLNGFYNHYMVNQIAYNFVCKLINNDHIFQLNEKISYNSLFYEEPKLSDEHINNFINSSGIFDSKEIDIYTKKPEEIILLEKKFNKSCQETIDKMNFYTMISSCHNSFVENNAQFENNLKNLLQETNYN
jgi:hypothetical protein